MIDFSEAFKELNEMELEEHKEQLQEYFNPNDPSDVEQHWERHKDEFPEFSSALEYEKRADEVAMKLPRGLIGTEDEVCGYTEYVHNEDRKVSYLPSTTEFVSFSQEGTPDKFGKLYRSQIRDYSFHKEPIYKFRQAVMKYFKEDNTNALIKCAKAGNFEKLYVHKKYLDSCGIDTEFLEKYFPENWLVAKGVEELNKKFNS